MERFTEQSDGSSAEAVLSVFREQRALSRARNIRIDGRCRRDSNLDILYAHAMEGGGTDVVRMEREIGDAGRCVRLTVASKARL